MKKKQRYNIVKEKIIAGLLIVCVLICCIAVDAWHKQMILREQSTLISVTYPYPTNSYDWDQLSADGYYMTYQDAEYTSVQGIDVSSHQGEIDWQAVADAGIQFAFVRAAYRGYETGAFYADDMFDQNMQGASANGIETGIYVFSQAITIEEAAEEADYAVSSAKKYKIDLPIVFDMESTADGNECRVNTIDAEKRAQMAVTFMNRVKAAGYDAMYYGSTSLLENLFELQYLQEYPLWVAEYGADYPKYPYQFEYWQYSSTAEIPGIEGRYTDMDIRFVKKS